MPSRGFRTHLDVAACHEAGHALAVLWQGMRLVGIEVSLGNPGAGRTVYHLPRERSPYDPTRGPGCARAAWEDTVSRTLREARVALVGPLAEARLLRLQPIEGSLAYQGVLTVGVHASRLAVNHRVRQAWISDAIWSRTSAPARLLLKWIRVPSRNVVSVYCPC